MNISTIIKASAFIAGASILIGCDDDGPKIVNSDTVSTNQVFATYQVFSDGSQYVYAEAQLTRLTPPSETEDEDSFVHLVDKDELWFASELNLLDQQFSSDVFGELEQLRDTQTRFKASTRQEELYNFIFFRTIINPFGNWYSAQLPLNTNGIYQISLFRENTVEARYSTITLPNNFSIIAPDSLALYSRSMDDIIVEWNNTETDLSVEIETTVACPDQSFESYSETLTSDSGTYVIPAGTLSEPHLVGRCTTTINVRKALLGTIDPNLVGGLASGYQIRRVSFVSED
ncbi:hypothetical protein TDB9533_01417 [Thalassocella blandensis]|nr:hypothetical protein TDB9533_01417 [Thalassocella blandensis]